MSRLDSVIRRLQAQRACLDRAAALIEAVPGVVLELGLGNGRTYDHLRERLPGREIFVFDRQVAAHPDSTPDADHLVLGSFDETLPNAKDRFAGQVALVHADIGSGHAERDAETAAFIARHLPDWLAPGAIVAGDQAMAIAGAEDLALPDGVNPGRYFLYRKL
ncbi:MAG: class I SAM-dependent methyltransferase [Kiloniellales bacterium]|nr:class I SAM-dependent methyltransferase [Kiloniellales bacterium]